MSEVPAPGIPDRQITFDVQRLSRLDLPVWCFAASKDLAGGSDDPGLDGKYVRLIVLIDYGAANVHGRFLIINLRSRHERSPLQNVHRTRDYQPDVTIDSGAAVPARGWLA